jgi:hypothetical protein
MSINLREEGPRKAEDGFKEGHAVAGMSLHCADSSDNVTEGGQNSESPLATEIMRTPVTPVAYHSSLTD